MERRLRTNTHQKPSVAKRNEREHWKAIWEDIIRWHRKGKEKWQIRFVSAFASLDLNVLNLQKWENYIRWSSNLTLLVLACFPTFSRQFALLALAPHSSTLAWKIPGTEEPGGLQSMGSLWVGHDWATFHISLSCIGEGNGNPLQVFLPGESQGRGSLVGCRLWGRTESDTTEVT